MLDLESFTYLSRALESSIAPIVILASNRGRVPIRTSSSSTDTTASATTDTDLISAHGIPPDLLARLLIIPTHPYSPSEIKTIIRLRARTEGLTLSDAALTRVSDKGSQISLRYALQLLAPASVLAKVAGRAGEGAMVNGKDGASGSVTIEEQDVEECEGLFLDARRSAAMLNEHQGKNGFVA